MIGQFITGEDGKPLADAYKSLSKSEYQPPNVVKDLWVKVQSDYQVAYILQHRPFREFDGFSLLQRARMDQETFAAYVGCEWVPQHKRWRWKGRKNTSRNKLIAILARMIAGMLYPSVNARNEMAQDDKMAARVMKMRIEDHLRKAGYEVKFLFMTLSALVNPATIVEVEWVERMKKVKTQTEDGGVNIEEFVDEVMSGVAVNTVPVDEIMACDFYSGTGNLSVLPVVLRVRRIPWDDARAKWSGRFFSSTDKDEAGNPMDLFSYVKAGMTRIFLTGSEHQELFDIEWTEADRNYVQEATIYYPYEDLEVTMVGGVLLINEKDPYNTNPFTHRRFTLVNGEWKTVPVLRYAMSGFEPIDPAGRFLYYKSGAFKEFWDDAALNKMHQLAHDGTYLDTIKPMFLPGVSKIDGTVLVPGAVFGIPAGQEPRPFSVGPNLKSVFELIEKMEENLSDSTRSDPIPPSPQPNVTAMQTQQAVMQAKVFTGVFALLMADLIRKIGELVVDLEINYAAIGKIDEKIRDHLELTPKTFVMKGRERGRNITNRVIFTSKHMGKRYSQAQLEAKEWELYNASGRTPRERAHSSGRTYEVNPYQYARMVYEIYADADQIVDRSIGATQQRKVLAFQMMADPRVAPFTDMQNVVDDFVIDEWGGDDPDRYRAKQKPSDEMLQSIMQPRQPGAPAGSPAQSPAQPEPLPA